jgi:hypothetical protein
VSITIDKIRLLQEQAAAQLGSEWVAENGPHLPMETIKTGMVSVHTEYQALQAECSRQMLRTIPVLPTPWYPFRSTFSFSLIHRSSLVRGINSRYFAMVLLNDKSGDRVG